MSEHKPDIWSGNLKQVFDGFKIDTLVDILVN